MSGEGKHGSTIRFLLEGKVTTFEGIAPTRTVLQVHEAAAKIEAQTPMARR